MSLTDDFPQVPQGINEQAVAAAQASVLVSNVLAGAVITKVMDALSFINEKKRHYLIPDGTQQTSYMTHIIGMLDLLVSVAGAAINSDVMCATILHRVLEDKDIAFGDLQKRFGTNVASIVKELWDPSLSVADNFRERLTKSQNHSFSANAQVVLAVNALYNVRFSLSKFNVVGNEYRRGYATVAQHVTKNFMTIPSALKDALEIEFKAQIVEGGNTDASLVFQGTKESIQQQVDDYLERLPVGHDLTYFNCAVVS